MYIKLIPHPTNEYTFLSLRTIYSNSKVQNCIHFSRKWLFLKDSSNADNPMYIFLGYSLEKKRLLPTGHSPCDGNGGFGNPEQFGNEGDKGFIRFPFGRGSLNLQFQPVPMETRNPVSGRAGLNMDVKRHSFLRLSIPCGSCLIH